MQTIPLTFITLTLERISLGNGLRLPRIDGQRIG